MPAIDGTDGITSAGGRRRSRGLKMLGRVMNIVLPAAAPRTARSDAPQPTTQRPWPVPCEHCPARPPSPPTSRACAPVDMTDPADSSTNTNMLLDQHRCHYRHPQRHTCRTCTAIAS